MSHRVKLFGIELDVESLASATQVVCDSLREPQSRCRFIVTPNVDHLVLLRRDAALREAYRQADWIFADGKPVVAAARWLGQRLPGVVPGSDLVPALLATSDQQHPLRYYLLGAAPGVAERAAERISARWPSTICCGAFSPPLGFEKEAAQNTAIVDRINQAQPDLLVLGLGAPKQERWIAAHAALLQAKVAICAGATIDFLAGEKKRAPRWMRKVALEWLHRMSTEPQRLLPRYAKDAWYFPQIVFQQWRLQRRL